MIYVKRYEEFVELIGHDPHLYAVLSDHPLPEIVAAIVSKMTPEEKRELAELMDPLPPGGLYGAVKRYRDNLGALPDEIHRLIDETDPGALTGDR